MRKIYLFLIVSLFLISFVSSTSLDNLGTFKKDECVRIKQTCSSCSYINLTISYPNSTEIINNAGMDSLGAGTWVYNFCNTSLTGRYEVTGEGDIDGIAESFATYFMITLSGTNPSDSNPYIPLGIIALIFGISCIFLYISSQLQEPGPKIFFLLGSFVFIIGSLAISYVIAFDSNLTSSINTTIKIMLFAFGMIFIIMFAYIMIKQTVEVLELYRSNKGYEMEL